MIDYEQMAQDVLDGKESPFRALGIIRQLKQSILESEKIIADVALDEARKEDRIFEMDGFKFEKRNGAKRFSFKNIAQHVQLTEQIKEIEDDYKLAWQQSQKNIMAVDENGELLELPEVKYGKDVLIVKQI